MKDVVLRVAAKAVIGNDEGQVLILREGGKYDEGSKIGQYGLPGGRLNVGETFEDGLRREAKEETGLDIEPIKPLQVGEWHPVIKGIEHQIIAIFMLCKAKANKVVLSDEHDDYQWVNPADDLSMMMEPDRSVVANMKV
jgi:8-oxo-dGTP diphosphatase